MIRLVAATSAVVLFGMPLLVAPIVPLIALGAIGLLLATAGLLVGWRWPITAAAGVFIMAYTVAVWIAHARLDVVSATALGLTILVMLQSGEIARGARDATLEASVLRAQLVGWALLAGAMLASASVVLVIAAAVASAIPARVAPIIAAAGALGVVLALAAALTRATR